MLEASIEVLEKLEEKNFKAYIVGGFVRDYILGIKTIDVDICTNAKPKEILEIFPNAIPNEEYGSIILNYKKINFEITTFRKEKKYINHRKPTEIEYTNDLNEDLQRRDITINTFCMTSDKEIIDILGADKDLNNKIIKVVGDPVKKLEEDALRILRCVRFATKLNFKIDNKTIHAIKKNSKYLKEISYYRKKEELDKIFASKNSKYGIKLIKKLGLDKTLELNNIKKLKLVDDIHGIWAQLNVLDKYTFNKKEYDTISKIETLLNEKTNILDPYIIYKYGAYITSIVAEIKGIKKDKINDIYGNLSIYNKEDIKTTGDRIIEILNREPGKWVSEIINDIEKQIIYKKLNNNPNNIEEYIIKKYK